MSHTNSTPNYNLPQFITTDKPFWLTDINGAFSAIDTGIDAAKDAADNAQSDATQALTDAGNADTKATGAKNTADGAIASIADQFSNSSAYAVGDYVIYNNLLYKCTTAVTTPGDWTGSLNWTRTTIEDILATKANTSALATVATSGSYNDLINKPTEITSYNTIVKSANAQGFLEFSLSEIGCTEVPKAFIAIACSDGFILRYNYDVSLTYSKVFCNIYHFDGSPITSGNYRISYICIQ